MPLPPLQLAQKHTMFRQISPKQQTYFLNSSIIDSGLSVARDSGLPLSNTSWEEVCPNTAWDRTTFSIPALSLLAAAIDCGPACSACFPAHTHVFSMLSCTHTCFRKEDTSNKTNGPSTSFIATYVSELVFSDNQDVGATHRNHFAHQVNCKVELVHRIIMIISFLSLPEESITGNASLFWGWANRQQLKH